MSVAAPSGAASGSLDAIKSAQARQRPIVMIVPGAGGPPHVCVPDCGELRVLDDRSLRVAIWPDAPIAADLDGGAPVLLIVPSAPDVHLIQATARRQPGAAMIWAHYDLSIASAQVVAPGTAPHTQPSDVVEVLAMH